MECVIFSTASSIGCAKIVHRIDAPFVSCIVVSHMRHAVQDRISHIDIRGCHVYPGTEYLFSIFVNAILHIFK